VTPPRLFIIPSTNNVTLENSASNEAAWTLSDSNTPARRKHADVNVFGNSFTVNKASLPKDSKAVYYLYLLQVQGLNEGAE